MRRVLALALGALLLTGCGAPDAAAPPPSQTAEQPPQLPTAPPEADTAETHVPEQTPEPPPQEPDEAAVLLAQMTPDEKLCQLFVLTPEALTGVTTATVAGATTEAALAAYPVGGLCYFAKNLLDAGQTTAMLTQTQAYARYPLFLAVDEEGGTVSRIGSNPAMGATAFPPMGEVADAYGACYTIGSEIRALGFNLDFAPVADVNSNPDNPVIGTRAFSSDATVAAAQVAQAVAGFQDGGVLCTLKHFPGHGDTATDSHNGLAQTDKTLDALRQMELLPFAAGIEAGAPIVMVGHIAAPQVTGDETPASLSPAIVTDLLRGELGFSGLVITDALNMGAITQAYSAGEAAVLAIAAGVDLLLMPEDFPAALDGLRQAVADGRLSEQRIDESVTRILRAKQAAGLLDRDS